ncbi:MAG TPA: hypothetical protein VM686_27105 [Polyangiaceae bacterium]|jgi:hypothetical protein|nr:hypothetical protein [Polyangiaceae bacterium]
MLGQAEAVVITVIGLILFSQWFQETLIAGALVVLVVLGAYGIIASVPPWWWVMIAAAALSIGLPMALRKYPKPWEWLFPVLSSMVSLATAIAMFFLSAEPRVLVRGLPLLAAAVAFGVSLDAGLRKAREATSTAELAVATAWRPLWDYLVDWLSYWTWRLAPFMPLAAWALIERLRPGLWSKAPLVDALGSGWTAAILAIVLNFVSLRICASLRAGLLARQARGSD